MFSYLGGKKFQSKWISSHFPKNDIYVEPFGGAFWVYFQSGINSQRNIYNDKNRYLANLFHCAVFYREKLLEDLKKFKPQDRKLFEDIKKELVPLTYDVELGDTKQAAKYIYIELNTFSGLTIENAKFVDLKGKYKSKYTQLIEKLENPKWQFKLDNIDKVDNDSYDNVIKRYDSEHTLFYCDPPYFEKENYYTKEFNQSEHLKLSNLLKSIKGKFILSYYNFPQLSKWYPKNEYNWSFKEFNKQNSSKDIGTNKGEEILITNFKSALTLE